MGFLAWFTGKLGVGTPVAVVKPAPVLPPASAPIDGTKPKIKIENHSRTLFRWLEMPVPFASSSECHFDDIEGDSFTVKITVLEGELTVVGTYCNGPHNPKITKFKKNQVFPAGSVFIVEGSNGKATGQPANKHPQQVNFGLTTKELGQILKLTTLVVYY